MFRLFYAVRANLESIGTQLREKIARLFVVSRNRRRATPPILPPTLSEHRTGPEPRPTALEPPQQILQTSARPSTYVPSHLKSNWTALNIARIARDYHEASRKFSDLLIQAAEECWEVRRHGRWPKILPNGERRIQPSHIYHKLARVVSAHNPEAVDDQMKSLLVAEIKGRNAAITYYRTCTFAKEQHPGGHEHFLEDLKKTKIILFGHEIGD